MTALRRLGRDRLFAGFAIGTLAAGIGLATALHGVVKAVLLAPLPYSDPDRLVWVWATRTDRDKAFFSIPNFLETRDASQSFETLSALSLWGANVTGAGAEPERLQGLRVTTDLLPMLGVRPAAGRLLGPGDESRPVAVLSHALWKRRYGGDRAAVGSSLALNDKAHQIVGVLPHGFTLPNVEWEILVPLSLETEPRRTDRGTNFLRCVGRLAGGASTDTAAAELATITRRLVSGHPDVNAKLTAPRVIPLLDELVGAHRTLLWATFSACLLLLLLAATNVSHLLLARAVARAPEMAARSALGASAAALARQLLAEAGALAAVGGAGGLLLGAALVRGLTRLGPAALPRLAEARVDAQAALFTVALSALVTLLLGAAPAAWALRTDLLPWLRGRGIETGRSRWRGGLVVTQVAASLLLLSGSAAALVSLARLLSIDPGFDPAGLVTFRLSLPAERAPSPEGLAGFTDELVARLHSEPGVTAAAVAGALPLSGANVRTDFTIVGRPAASAAEIPGAQLRWVGPGFFQALGIRLLDGRTIDERDVTSARRVAVVDEALVKAFLAGANPVGGVAGATSPKSPGPVGMRIVVQGGAEQPEHEIVGVVANVKHFTLDETPLPTLYLPVSQVTRRFLPFVSGSLSVAMRGPARAEALLPGLKRQVRGLAPEVPLSSLRGMDETLAASVAPRRFAARLLALFGGAALLLATLGVYALGCQTAVARRGEMGLRLALGASPAGLVAQLVGEGLRRVGGGLALGLLLTIPLARLLPQGAPLPPDATGLVTSGALALALLLLASTVAILVPAVRASRLAPARILMG